MRYAIFKEYTNIEVELISHPTDSPAEGKVTLEDADHPSMLEGLKTELLPPETVAEHSSIANERSDETEVIQEPATSLEPGVDAYDIEEKEKQIANAEPRQETTIDTSWDLGNPQTESLVTPGPVLASSMANEDQVEKTMGVVAIQPSDQDVIPEETFAPVSVVSLDGSPFEEIIVSRDMNESATPEKNTLTSNLAETAKSDAIENELQVEVVNQRVGAPQISGQESIEDLVTSVREAVPPGGIEEMTDTKFGSAGAKECATIEKGEPPMEEVEVAMTAEETLQDESGMDSTDVDMGNIRVEGLGATVVEDVTRVVNNDAPDFEDNMSKKMGAELEASELAEAVATGSFVEDRFHEQPLEVSSTEPALQKQVEAAVEHPKFAEKSLSRDLGVEVIRAHPETLNLEQPTEDPIFRGEVNSEKIAQVDELPDDRGTKSVCALSNF